MVEIDIERAERVYHEMMAEYLEKYPNLSGHARLLFESRLREAVWKGVQAYERKKLLKERRLL